jgi:hypothetical protein
MEDGVMLGGSEAQKDRRWMLAQNEAPARHAFGQTRRGLGDDDLVVFVIDLRDPVGQQIIEPFSRTEGVAERRCQVAGVATHTCTIALPRPAVHDLPGLGPRGRKVLSTPARPGYFWCVVVASGGNLIAQVPFGEEAVAPAEQAADATA